MRRSILVCIFPVLIVMISACVAPKIKKDDLLIEPNIKQRISSESPIILYVEDFGFAKSISDPSVVGEANVGMLNFPALIRSEVPVHLIITDQMKRGLLKAGFKLDVKEKAHFTISGRIERFWVDERIGMWSENSKASVRYDLIVKDNRRRFVWGDNIVGRATSGKSMETTKDDVPTLVNALKNSIESIFANESFWKAVGQ